MITVRIPHGCSYIFIEDDGKTVNMIDPDAWFLERRIRKAIKKYLKLRGVMQRVQEDFNP